VDYISQYLDLISVNFSLTLWVINGINSKNYINEKNNSPDRVHAFLDACAGIGQIKEGRLRP
jgi:hypothetical protein